MSVSEGIGTLPNTLGLAVALGCGLLIGIERERRKGQGPQRAAAGVRSFALTSCMGGLAQWLQSPALVLAGAVLVAVLAAIAYWRGLRTAGTADDDPGLTTELALFATYLIGVTAITAPAVAAACGAGLALLLAARSRLHRFSTQWLTDAELHDGLLLAALGLIAMPLLPERLPATWPLVGGLAVQSLAGLLVLILVLQAAAHTARRVLGARVGLPLTGFVSGFVSSTATVATLGRQAFREPGQVTALASAAGLSGSATWMLAGLIVATIAPGALWAVAPAVLAGAIGPAVVAGFALRRATGVGDQASVATLSTEGTGPLRIREAAVLAAGLLGITTLFGGITRWLGTTAIYPGVAFAALADTHAAVASLALLNVEGGLSQQGLVWGLLLAVAVNTAVRVVVAQTTGGWVYARQVGAALGLSWGLALAASWASAAGSGR